MLARDEQLPRGHRARLPGAVRGVVRAQHPRRARDHQGRSSARSRDARASQGALVPAAAAFAHRQARRGRRLGPCGARGGAAARARRARRRRLRARRPHRRPPPLRHPRLQDGEGHPRRARRADARRGRDASASASPSGRTCAASSSCTTSTPSCSRSARARRAICPSPGRELARRPLRDGVPRAAEPPRRRRRGATRDGPSSRRASASSSSAAATPGRTASGRRSARARRACRSSSSCPSRALVRMPDEPVARVAARPPHVDVAGGGRASATGRCRRARSAARGRARRRRSRRVRVGLEGGKIKRLPGHRARRSRATSSFSRWASSGRSGTGIVEQLGLALDARGNVRTDASGATSVPGRLRRGRRVARAVARRVGDRRRPPRCGRGRRVPAPRSRDGPRRQRLG